MVDGPPAESVRDILASRATRERGIYDVDEILSVLHNKHRIEPQAALRLFHVAEFEPWHGIHRSSQALHLPGLARNVGARAS